MIDVDPRLDAKLQAFFEHIEASAPPAGLSNIDTTGPARTRMTFNLFAGLAAAAVVAGSVAVFALELRSHNTPGPGPAATSASPSARPSALKKMPLLGSAGIPASAHKVMPLTRGQGSVLLQTFVPQGTLYIQFDCAGPGPFKFLSTDHVIGNGQLQCSSDIGVTTITVGSPKVYDDKPLTLQVTADDSMTWEIYIAESRPPLPELTVEPDQRVLVPVTYGTGSITLPTFSVAPGEWLDVREACNSGSTSDAIEMVGNTYFGDDGLYGCSSADGSFGGGGSGPPGLGGSGPISVRVITAPAISWEILITEGPTALLLPSSGDVAVAPAAYGMGSAELPAFTSTQPWTIAVVCSGVGTLSVGSSTFTQTAMPGCVGWTQYLTPSGEVPGQPVSLSVNAPSGMGWEIFIYRVGPPPACPPVVAAASSPTPCVEKSG